MKQKFLYKITALICVLSLSVLCIPVSAVELVLPPVHENLQTQRANLVFSQKIEEMQPVDPALRVAITGFTTREITDFSGNLYTLIECKPSGYLIYHNASGVFAEASLYSPSPYKSFSGTLYYNGPTNYYAQSSGGLIHAITHEKVDLNLKLTQHSNDVNDVLLAKKDTETLNYIEHGTSTTFSPNSIQFTAASNIYVDGPSLIRNLKTASQIGYMDGGYCGYIAAGMAMLYLQVYSGLIIIPSEYLVSTKVSFNGSSFTSLLRTYGPSNATTAYSLASSLNEYFDEHNYIVTAKSSYFGSANTTKNYIQNDQPVMVGGMYASNPNDSSSSRVAHFILAYGYGPADSSGPAYFIVHYGWPNYSEVQINNGLFILQSTDYVVLNIGS